MSQLVNLPIKYKLILGDLYNEEISTHQMGLLLFKKRSKNLPSVLSLKLAV
jgi:hypothetical protein